LLQPVYDWNIHHCKALPEANDAASRKGFAVETQGIVVGGG
jgi:hypothetical protein